MNRPGLALIAITAASLAAPAAAEPRSATITISRADFASPQAKAQLDRRVRGAIETVCGSYASIESSQSAELDSCWQETRAQADSKIAKSKLGARVEISSR